MGNYLRMLWSYSDSDEGQSSDNSESDTSISEQSASTLESSPPASQAQNEDHSTCSQTDHSNTVNVSKEPDTMKAKQNNEPTNTEQLQTITSKAGKSKASNIIIADVNKELGSIKTEQDVSCNKTEVFCSKPGKPIATDITSKGIEIEWTKPEQGTENDISYTVLHRSANDPDDQWRVIANVSEEKIIVSKLTEGSSYYFKIQLYGFQSESDSSKPIKMVSPTLRNVLNKILKAETKWYYIGLCLEPKEGDLKLDAIKIDNCNTQDRLTNMIQSWLKQTGGSWRKLIEALNQATVGFDNLAKSIADGIGLTVSCCTFEETALSDKDEYKDYLNSLYSTLKPTRMSGDIGLPSATDKVFNLAMIKTKEVRIGQIPNKHMTKIMTGSVKEILLDEDKEEIQLKDIIEKTEGQRKVILLEGAAGCGKSTLSAHIAQQCQRGKLFKEFDYVILIQLRNHILKPPESVTDLLPSRDGEMREKAASKMYSNDGQGVLFILDGWDELPSDLRTKHSSIFHRIIKPDISQKNPLLKSAVIVTSRPIASFDLQRLGIVSARIEILGFTPEQLHEYFAKCLDNSTALKCLKERIDEIPAMVGGCSLPLNACILVNVFRSLDNSLPPTVYEIFEKFILNHINRHQDKLTKLNQETLSRLDSLDNLHFKESICKLAYEGVKAEEYVFSSEKVCSNGPQKQNLSRLGVFQGVQSLTTSGCEETSYHFFHLFAQELLAAFYIAKLLKEDEQESKFDEFFYKSHFSAVLQFYAAITKLEKSKIKSVIMRVATKCNANHPIGKDRSLLLSLLHCLYEAQNPSLCQSVAQKLQNGLDLHFTTLTPSHCLCIGYFLSHTCKMDTGTHKFEVNLNNCSIGDHGCKYLARGLKKNQDTHSAVSTLFTMNLGNNAITHCGDLLSTLLKVGCIEDLRLGSENNSKKHSNKLQDVNAFMELLKGNSTLRRLDLSMCGLTSPNAKSLAEALTANRHLEELDISSNKQLLCDDGIQHLARILTIRGNRGLKKLHLRGCSITSLSAESLAAALTTNKRLEELDISDNALGDNGIQHLADILQNNQYLKKLELASCGMTDVGLEYLAKSLERNKVLESLNISTSADENKNLITKKMIPFLVKSLQNNQALTTLSLPMSLRTEFDRVTSDIQQAISNVEKRSKLPFIQVEDDFMIHLKFLYKRTQTSTNTWPPSATRKVFNLAMVRTKKIRRRHIDDEFLRMTITGKIDDILERKIPIQLEGIFSEEQKVVLLEGAPGCGKSTLSVHISQQWGEGKLFREFKYVILVRLRDPAVQTASCIADLLPARDDEIRQQAAEDITATDGEGVLFILDGWENLPSSLRKNSIFCDMVQSRSLKNNPLLKSRVMITSRPIASLYLHNYVSTHIEILGFTRSELRNYFTDCLKGDSKAVETLFERIDENPAIAGSCYLPMNANILVHLFIDDNNTLPTTQYGIFSKIILSCIYRHHSEHTQFKNLTLESLQQIPEAIKEPFLFLCELAYQGIMDDRVIFSLPADINTLGLLQGVESFVRQGNAVSYNFLHLSIQELLGGLYMATQLPNNEQVTKFSELFDNSRVSFMFQFYAAITKLQTPGIKDFVIRVAMKHNKTHLLALLHCLYEAQNAFICECVAQQLQHGLDLSSTALTPPDCLCIGYYLSHVCKVATGNFEIDLMDCCIGDQGFKYLVSGLLKYLDTHGPMITPRFMLNLRNNDITHRGVNLYLSILLKLGCIEELKLGCALKFNFWQQGQNKLGSLQGIFIEQLKNDSILNKLDLSGCGLTSLSAKSLAEVITINKYLEKLYLSGNAELGDDGIQHLVHALRVNQGLKKLNLISCELTSLSTKGLAEALTTNEYLEELNISRNALQDDGIEDLAHALRVNRSLKKLSLTYCGLTSLGAKSLAEALTTKTHLEELNISVNELGDDGIRHVARALQVNQQLKKIELANCSITDTGLQYLTKAIQVNHVLKILTVHNQYYYTKNTITENIIPVLIECLQNNHTLTELYLPVDLISSISTINKAVNETRKRSGLPLIEVEVKGY